jgi:hypothetical protein
LLTAVLAYPRQPTSTDRKRMYQRVANIPSLSGDASFSRACSRLLDVCPVAPYLDNSDALLVWYARFKARMCDIYGDSCERQPAELVEDYMRRMKTLPPKPRPPKLMAFVAVSLVGVAMVAREILTRE